MTWNDDAALRITCPECGSGPGVWCTYVQIVTGEMASWADPGGTRNTVRHRVGQPAKRLHNSRRPVYDQNGRCRVWLPPGTPLAEAVRKYRVSGSGFIQCGATRDEVHLKGCGQGARP